MRVTKGSGNVFVDCGFPPAEAENLRIRAKLMMALTGYIQERKITQGRAAKIMGVSQPRISDLVRGKIGCFTTDTLINMLRVLFDKNVPYLLRRHLIDYQVRTADHEGWGQISNGELIGRAEKAGYQIILTRDQNIRYEQNRSEERRVG